MSYLILVRHGESRWNLANKFTGWVDVPLSQMGIEEAEMNALELSNLPIDIAFTSDLIRAQETLLLILAKQRRTGIFMHDQKNVSEWKWYKTALDDEEIPIFSSPLLNERYYGKLQGLNKNEVRNKYGKVKVFGWRRSFSERPPGGESLKDVYLRIIPYLRKEIIVRLKKNNNIIVSAHGNSLRAIIKYIEKISDNDIAQLELPNGYPVVYKYQQGKLLKQTKQFSFDRPLYWHKQKR